MPEDARLDRDAILAAVDLPALADVVLGARDGDARSPWWPCPSGDHDPDSPMPPHVSVFEDRQGAQRWHCPNCGADGTAVELVMTVRRIGLRDALQFLANGVGADAAHPRAADPGAHDLPTHSDAPHNSQSLQAFVRRSSECLWQAPGERTLRWLTEDRHLPEDVLRFHRIGATRITLTDKPAPDGLRPQPSLSTEVAVLPVFSGGKAAYAALRLVEPPQDRGPYLTPLNATNQTPPLGPYRPPRRRRSEIVVTSGILDALAANAAGYRSVSVLAHLAEVPTERHHSGQTIAEAAVHLARLNGPLVLAPNQSLSSGEATDLLAEHLWARGRRPALLAEMGRDLSDSLAVTSDWPRKLDAHVRLAVASGPPDVVLER